MRFIFFLILLIFFVSKTKAQFENRFSAGIKSGVAYSTISGIDEIIHPEAYWNRSKFSFEPQGRFGYAGGFFINYKSTGFDSFFAIHSEINFRMGGERMFYRQPAGFYIKLINNIPTEVPYPELNYEMEFLYNYLEISTLVKFYPFAKMKTISPKGLNIGIGPQISFNLSPNQITYTSDSPIDDASPTATDPNIQNDLRLSLEGQNIFSGLINLGYEFPMGLAFDFRYGYGLNDAIETIFNFDKWINNKNRPEFFQFGVYYNLIR